MGKRAYINDGNDNWIPLVSSLPNLDAYATKDYVDINLLDYSTIDYVDTELENIDLSPYLTIDSASSTYLTQSSASTQYERLIPYSSSSVVNVQTGDLWIDSSGSSPLLKTYDGTEWVQLGGSDNVFVRLNLQTIEENYTMPTGYNGVTAGPITIADGVTVTIPDGSAWSVV
jgi:hypothetical protein